MPFFVFLLILALLSPIYVSSHSTVLHPVISEVQSTGDTSPPSDDEFIELYNPTDCPFDISGWGVARATSISSGSLTWSSVKVIGSGVSIAAHGYYLIASTAYNGSVLSDLTYSATIANSGYVALRDQDKAVIDYVGYGVLTDPGLAEGGQPASPGVALVSNTSIERISGQDINNNRTDFIIRTASDPQNSQSPANPAPGICTAPPPPPSPPPSLPPGEVAGGSIITITQARQTGLDETVATSGVVTAAPGQLSASYFYIQDETAGIQVYSSKKSFPTLTIGQRVQVTGVTSEAYKERRLKTADAADISLIGSGNIQTSSTKSGSIGESYEGRLVRLSGTVSQTSGDTFYINDGSGEARIYIRAETGIDKPRMSKGDKVTVVGIVSQYNDTYRVLPREQNDLSVGGDEFDGEGSGVDGSGVAGSSDEESEAGSDSSVVFARENNQPRSTPLSNLVQFPQVRLLGFGGIIVGALLLLLIPLMIWEKRSGWLRNRLSKPKDSSRE